MRKWLRVPSNLIGCIKGSAHRGWPFLYGEALRKAAPFAYGASFWFRGLRGLDAFPAFGSAELNLGRVRCSFLSRFLKKWHKFAVVNDWIENVERHAKSDLGLYRHASSKRPKSCHSTVHNRKSLPFFSIWGHASIEIPTSVGFAPSVHAQRNLIPLPLAVQSIVGFWPSTQKARVDRRAIDAGKALLGLPQVSESLGGVMRPAHSRCGFIYGNPCSPRW